MNSTNSFINYSTVQDILSNDPKKPICNINLLSMIKFCITLKLKEGVIKKYFFLKSFEK